MQIMPFGQPDIFEVPSLPSGWGNPFIAPAAPMAEAKPAYHNDIQKKKQFGIELAKRKNQLNAAFNAGLVIFGDDTSAALWVSREWVNDPIVLAAREEQLSSQVQETVSLDREQFAARLLQEYEAKNLSGTAYLYDDKERVNLLKLYADVKGFLKQDAAPIINNNLVQGLTIKLVKVEPKEEPKPINQNSEIQNQNSLPVKLKLVG